MTAECRRLCARLSRYLDDDLSATDCRRIERHLRECRRCDDAIADLQRAVRACRRAARTKLPADVQRRAVARITALLATRPSRAAG